MLVLRVSQAQRDPNRIVFRRFPFCLAPCRSRLANVVLHRVVLHHWHGVLRCGMFLFAQYRLLLASTASSPSSNAMLFQRAALACDQMHDFDLALQFAAPRRATPRRVPPLGCNESQGGRRSNVRHVVTGGHRKPEGVPLPRRRGLLRPFQKRNRLRGPSVSRIGSAVSVGWVARRYPREPTPSCRGWQRCDLG